MTTMRRKALTAAAALRYPRKASSMGAALIVYAVLCWFAVLWGAYLERTPTPVRPPTNREGVVGSLTQ